jgi:hypothetical protein
MSVIDKLASSLNRRGEKPNLELARRIAETNDRKALTELAKNLTNKDRGIRSDCIKVLYEVGERKPGLIAQFAGEFASLLDSTDNRLVWGAMTALDCIALERPETLREMLPKVLEVADRGSVITRDHAVGILTKLSSIGRYADSTVPLLVEQLRKSPGNQLPMYAEKAMPIITEKNRDVFLDVFRSRLGDLQTQSKRRRVEKVIEDINLVQR